MPNHGQAKKNKKLEHELEDLQSLTSVDSFVVGDEEIFFNIETLVQPEGERFQAMLCKYKVRLSIPTGYSRKLPKVYLLDWTPPDGYDHVNRDGSLCLEIPSVQRKIFERKPCLVGFVEGLLLPNLYSIEYYKKHKDYPFDQRAHGFDGIYKYHKKDLQGFSISNEKQCYDLLRSLYNYRGHHDCYCGSGLKVRNCHGDRIRQFTRDRNLRHYYYDIKQYEDEKKRKKD